MKAGPSLLNVKLLVSQAKEDILEAIFIIRLARLHGEAERQFSAIIGWKALKESVELFGEDSPATVLKPDLSTGIDPDDYFSSIPYGKYHAL
jgi:hypothetical protein